MRAPRAPGTAGARPLPRATHDRLLPGPRGTGHPSHASGPRGTGPGAQVQLPHPGTAAPCPGPSRGMSNGRRQGWREARGKGRRERWRDARGSRCSDEPAACTHGGQEKAGVGEGTSPGVGAALGPPPHPPALPIPLLLIHLTPCPASLARWRSRGCPSSRCPATHIPAGLPQGPVPALPAPRDSRTFMDTIRLSTPKAVWWVFLPASVPAACPGVG